MSTRTTWSRLTEGNLILENVLPGLDSDQIRAFPCLMVNVGVPKSLGVVLPLGWGSGFCKKTVWYYCLGSQPSAAQELARNP